jgi:RNase P subunit RPR2
MNGMTISPEDPVLLMDMLPFPIMVECGMTTCDKCRGAMLPERAVDLNAGLAITVFACLNCGRRKSADQEPRPITARY